MRCFHPISIRNPVKKSRRYLVDSVYRRLYENEPDIVEVPCGKCVACRKNRQNEWAFRIMAESKLYPGRTWFVTLTYDDAHLHYFYHRSIDDVDSDIIAESGDYSNLARRIGTDSLEVVNLKRVKVYTSRPSLDKLDAVNFFKRLRKHISFRYFCCGEYGDKFGRPHMHFILFLNDTLSKDELHSFLVRSWKLCDPDQIDVKDFGPGAAKYVAKYSVKRAGINYFDCQLPFSLSSKKPAIGAAYLNNPNTYRQLRENGQYLVYDSQGTPYSLPRYYRDKVFSDSERLQFQHENESKLIALDNLSARLAGLSLDGYRKLVSSRNYYLEKNYFDKLRIDNFGYDFPVDYEYTRL